LNDAKFLNYRQSMIAACSIIIGINIFEKENLNISNANFFKNCKTSNGKTELNLEFWNNQYVHNLTGYSLDDLRVCLYDLAMFISDNLQPDRLESFDLNSINTTKLYSGYLGINMQQVILRKVWNLYAAYIKLSRKLKSIRNK
jgi:hypothetical protein